MQHKMSCKKLIRIKFIEEAAIEILQHHDVITCKDFLDRSPLELMALLGYTYHQLQELTLTVSKATAPNTENILHLYQSSVNKSLPTSLGELDSALRGGLPAGMITEISGPPGCGKTQFCITVSAVTSFSSSENHHVVYIDTEGAFSADRLVEIAKYRFPIASSSDNLLALASRVHVYTEMTFNSLLDRLRQLEEVVVEKNIKLVIVDSIASLVRKEFDASSRRGVVDRAASLSCQAARLKYIAESFRIPILVTNQITTKVSHDQKLDESGVVTAALGNSWSHAVNTRLLMQYREGHKRMLTVSKSPLCELASFTITIEQSGLTLDMKETDKLSREVRPGEDPQLMSLAVRSSVSSHIPVQRAT